MDRNVFALLLSSAALGLSAGLYVFIFPLFMNDLGISFADMGLIFSVASVGMAIMGLILGWLSDLSGRKKFYSFTILLEFVATGVTPYVRGIWEMSIVKIFRDVDESLRAGLYPALLYDYTKKGFAHLLGTSQGFQWVMSSVGTFISAVLLLNFGFNGVFGISSLAAFIAMAIFIVGFTETSMKSKPVTFKGLRNAFSWNISRNLKFTSLSSLIWWLGATVSHSFIIPLFFLTKFNASITTVATIEGLHRGLSGPLMILAAQGVFRGRDLSQKRLKTTAALSTLYNGVLIVICGLSSNFYIAVIGWVTHDILGPPFRTPAEGTLVQLFSTDESRGRDTNAWRALQKIGGIVGPLLAGYLASIDLSLPIIVSGIIMIISPIFYLGIKNETAS